MLTIVVEVNAAREDAQGIKERIAMDLERYGDVRVVRIESDGKRPVYRQETIGGQRRWT